MDNFYDAILIYTISSISIINKDDFTNLFWCIVGENAAAVQVKMIYKVFKCNLSATEFT